MGQHHHRRRPAAPGWRLQGQRLRARDGLRGVGGVHRDQVDPLPPRQARAVLRVGLEPVRIPQMSREGSPVLTELLDGGIAKVVLNNPPLNVVTVRMSERLLETMKGLESDESVRAVVITGDGHKAFCAGADIKEFPSVRDRVVEKKLARENEAFGAIESLSKPVVAAIEGLAFGGGCEVADRKSVA